MIKHEDFITNNWATIGEENMLLPPMDGRRYYPVEFADLPEVIQREADKEAKKHKEDYFKFAINGSRGEKYIFKFSGAYCEIKTNYFCLVEQEYEKKGVRLTATYSGLERVKITDENGNEYFPCSYRELIIAMKMNAIQKRENILSQLEEELEKTKEELERIMKL